MVATIQRKVALAVSVLSLVASGVNIYHGIVNQKDELYFVLYVGLIVLFSVPIWLSILIESKIMKIVQVITVGGMSYLSCYISPHNPFALLGLVLMLLMIYRYEFVRHISQIAIICIGAYCLIVMFRVSSVELSIKYIADYIVMVAIYRILIGDSINNYLEKKMITKNEQISELKRKIDLYNENQRQIEELLKELKERIIRDKKIFLSIGGKHEC